MKKEQPDDETVIRPFAAYLTETNRGRTHTDLSQTLHDLTEQVLLLGKEGSMTLTVKVGVMDADAGQLKVTESISTKMPQPTPRTSIFFADGDGNLSRNDPNQMVLGDIKAVETELREAK